MFSKCTVIALAAVHLLVAMTGSAQEFSAPTVSFAEFGRASGGEMQATIKQPSRFSGSLGLTSARSSFFGGRGNTYGATLGGTLLKDKAWFFGTAERTDGLPIDPALSFNPGSVPRILSSYGTMNSLLGDRQSLVASASRGASHPVTVPASFLSLHYTGIVSSNMFFTAKVARHSSSEILPGFVTSVPTR